mgnify:CR=1 FL=1
MATYSFTNIFATVTGPGGSFKVSGDGAGSAEEGITAEMDEDKDTQTIGADGEVMHSLHAGRAGKITFRLLKTSPVNNLLSQLYNFQTLSSLTHGRNVIRLTDVARGDVVSGREAAFARQPRVNYSKDGDILEWVFNVGKLDMLLGSGEPDANN